jgi:hypothetical protein
LQGIAVGETEKEVNAFPATPVTVLINIGACSIDFYRLTKIPRRKPCDPLEILAEKRGRGKIQVVADFGDSLFSGAELRLCIHNDATLYPVGGAPPSGFHDDPRKILGAFAEFICVIRQVAMAAVFDGFLIF